MAFPADPLDVTVSLAIGADIHADPATWTWTDVTPLVRERQKVTITRGRRSRVGQVAPTRVSAVVDNTDGALCRHNPLGTHFGSLKKNTPMKIEVDNGSGEVTRAAVFVPGFPPSWDASETDQVVTLNAVGLLDRLGRGRTYKSPAYRAVQVLAPAAHWPCEDEAGATSAGSAVASRRAALPKVVQSPADSATDAVLFGETGPAGAAGAVRLSYNRMLSGTLPGGSPDAFTIGAWVKPAADPISGTQVAIWLGGSIRALYFQTVPEGGFVALGVAYSDGSTALDGGITTITTGEWHHIAMAAVTSGADVIYRLYFDGALIREVTDTAAAIANPTLLSASNVYAASVPATETYYTTVSGLAYWPAELTAAEVLTLADAGTGWVGEMAHDRVERLCTEDRVRVSVTATSSTPMGPQLTGTLLANLRDCANADRGILYETHDFGLAYLASRERYGAGPALTLQYDQGHILPPWEPDDDDQEYYNQVTATRPGGSTYRAADEDDIDDVGEYAIQVSPNVETDRDAGNVAGWQLALGLNDELTWPSVRPNLYASSTLRDDWLATGIGDQIHVTGHPAPLAPDAIKQVLEGYTETIGSYTWTVTAVLSPAEVYNAVGTYGSDADERRYDSATSALIAAVDDNDTTWTMIEASGVGWVTTASHPSVLPMDLDAGGLTYSCTAITSTAATFVAAGVAAHGSNTSVSPALPAGLAAGDLLLCLAAIRNSGTGTVDIPAGWTRMWSSGNVALLGKYATAGEAAPTVTFTGGVANADTSAQLAAFRDCGITVHASTAQLNSSAQDIAYPLRDVGRAGCVVLYLGWKQDDWTSVAGPGTEIGEPDTTTGDDQGLVWAYQIQTAATNVAAGSFTVTGGASAISRGAVVVVEGGSYDLTVTRLAADKSHAAGTQIRVHDRSRYGL